MPGRREARVFSLLAVVVGIGLCVWAVVLGFRGETFLGRPLGGDFVQFYVTGKILNNYQAWRIYDLKLAVDLQHATLPTMPQTQMLVFGQAPFIALLFRPVALLPYGWAYVAWLVFSAAVYAAALALVFRAARLTPENRTTGYLLALSAAPFLFETWIGGQVSVMALLCWALFFYCRYRNQPFLAGMALALLLFKPTLVALPAAMLLCGRLWRMAAGFCAGAVGAALLSLGAVGWQGVRAWVDTLLFDSRFTQGPVPVSHLAKDVSGNAFLHLLLPAAPQLATVMFLLAAAGGFAALAAAWWRRPNHGDALWAATVCFALVLSPYTPIYDVVLVVPAAALLASSMYGDQRDRTAFSGWLLLLYMTPWITQSFAEFLHFQPLTLVLATGGVWGLRLSRKRETQGHRGAGKASHALFFQHVTVRTEGNT